MHRGGSAAWIAAGVAMLLLIGCGGSGGGGDVERAFRKGDYKDAVAFGRHATRTGQDTPKMHVYYGMSLVGLGRDHEGFGEIDDGLKGDTSLRGDVADFLWKLAIAAPNTEQSARRMWKASQLSPKIDLGRWRFAVADAAFDDHDFASAAKLYDEATHAYPDTAACEQAYARLADCYRELDQPDSARVAMETLVKKFPHGLLADRAVARLDDIAFNEAQAAYDSTDYDQTIDLSKKLVDQTENRSLQQKARFLLGQAYEAKGDVADAYATYNEIIRSDRGDSGRIVERARSRIEALQEAGLQ